jgi:peptide/nickel transport system permease protein
MILLVPGNPAVIVAGPNATAEEIAETQERLGLNDRLVVQFGRWMGDALSGDLGQSLQGGADVTRLIGQRLPVTLGLALLSIMLTLMVAIPLATIAAALRDTIYDRIVTVMASLGIAVPSFWIAMILIIIFSLRLGWLPSSGYVPFTESPLDWLRFIIMPAIALAAAPTAEITRQMRASMIDVLEQDYIRTAHSKGLTSTKTLMKHAAKNAGVPVMTMIGLQMSFLLGGSVIVEKIFGVPGLGALSIDAVFQRDIPVIQGVVLVAGVAVLIVNLLVDLSYGFFNPKLRGS